MEIRKRLNFDRKDGALWVDATDLAEEILGDVIVKAELSVFIGLEDYTEEKAIKEAENLLKDVREKLSGQHEIRFDAEAMRFTFINGRQVIFWNSEWGGIRTLSKS